MADKSLLFTTDSNKEINCVQARERRLQEVAALGGSNVTETPDSRLLAKDKNGNLVSNPVLSDILNKEFVSVVRRGFGDTDDNNWVVFATTSNEENKVSDPEHSLLVSLSDLLLTIKIPSDVSSVTTEPLSKLEPVDPDDDESEMVPVNIDALCRYYGKPIKLDDPEEQDVLWKLISERTVKLHKNNGQSVSGKWELDLERINKKTPDVLFLNVTPDENLLSVDLDPSKVQKVPVIFTSDDNQDVFKLVLIINDFDLRPSQKQLKISNSVEGATFLTPWLVVNPVNNTVLTGANHEGGLLKTNGLTNTVKAVDAVTGTNVVVEVNVINTDAGFNTDGELDSVKLPSVPENFVSGDQSKNLVEDGSFKVKATVTAKGYESKVIDLSVCINNVDSRPNHLTLVLSHELVEYLNSQKALVNNEASTNEKISCTSRLGEADEVVYNNLSITGISGLDGETSKVVTSSVVDKNGAASKTVYVIQDENNGVKAFVFVKCECSGYVTDTLKLQLNVTDNRLPDGNQIWNVQWTTKPSVTIPNTAEGSKGDEIHAVVSSLGLKDALVATTGAITDGKIKDQWGHEESVDHVVVGIVDRTHPLSELTSDVVDIPKDAYSEIGCWLNVSILTSSGFVVVKKIQATVVDSRT